MGIVYFSNKNWCKCTYIIFLGIGTENKSYWIKRTKLMLFVLPILMISFIKEF